MTIPIVIVTIQNENVEQRPRKFYTRRQWFLGRNRNVCIKLALPAEPFAPTLYWLYWLAKGNTGRASIKCTIGKYERMFYIDGFGPALNLRPTHFITICSVA